MEKEESCLDELKKDYTKLQREHNLPSFKELNEDFQIEKIGEVETDIIIREIRKFMADKFSNYLRFIETLLNPVNAPMFVFSIIKSIDTENKNQLKEAYKKLAKIEVRLIELDVQFSEEKEIEFVKDSYKIWQDLKKDILGVLSVIKKNWDNKFETNGKSYFG